MEASRKHLEFMLTKVFTFPRNHQFDKVRMKEKLRSIYNFHNVRLGNELQVEGELQLWVVRRWPG